mmetsp:Transcript_5413/g.8272  ORF Transcript_5413/g.8272 Transcript_5413/m.8272 type:complete len:269 (+) Transcript_5413:41-847(+)
MKFLLCFVLIALCGIVIVQSADFEEGTFDIFAGIGLLPTVTDGRDLINIVHDDDDECGIFYDTTDFNQQLPASYCKALMNETGYNEYWDITGPSEGGNWNYFGQYIPDWWGTTWQSHCNCEITEEFNEDTWASIEEIRVVIWSRCPEPIGWCDRDDDDDPEHEVETTWTRATDTPPGMSLHGYEVVLYGDAVYNEDEVCGKGGCDTYGYWGGKPFNVTFKGIYKSTPLQAGDRFEQVYTTYGTPGDASTMMTQIFLVMIAIATVFVMM